MSYLGYLNFTRKDIILPHDLDKNIFLSQGRFNLFLEKNSHTGQNRPVFFISNPLNCPQERFIFNRLNLQTTLNYNERSDFVQDLFKLDLALGGWFEERNTELLLVRDIFGFTPVYFIFIPGELFIFSDNINNLKKINGDQLNNRFISDYLIPWKISYPTNSETFYQNIHSLLPGHYLTVNEESINMKSYLDFRPDRWNNQNPNPTFKDLFQNSISKLTAGSQSIGSHLSGGLDSSSVSCMLKHMYNDSALHTYHFESDSLLNKLSNDKKIANIVVERIASTHKNIEASLTHSFDYTYDFIKKFGQPSLMVSGPNQLMLIKEAALGDCKDLLLSGHGGDSIVGHGSEYLHNLLQQQDWQKLRFVFNEKSQYALNYRRIKRWNELPNDVKSEINFDTFIFQQIKRKRRLGYAFKILNSVNSYSTWKSALKQLTEWVFDKWEQKPINNNGFVNSDLPIGFKEVFTFDKPETLIYEKNSANQVYGYFSIRINEELSVIDYNTIPERHPFYDRDLFEYCLSISPEVKFNNGFTRGTLRVGLSEILPEELLNRRDKHTFDDYSILLTINLYEQSRDLLGEKAEIWEYANRTSFEKAIHELRFGNKRVYRSGLKIFILRVLNLAIWLATK